MKKFKPLLVILYSLLISSCTLYIPGINTNTRSSSDSSTTITTTSTTTSTSIDSTSTSVGDTSSITNSSVKDSSSEQSSISSSKETISSKEDSSIQESSVSENTGYYIDDSSIDDTFNYSAIDLSSGVSSVPSRSSTTVNLLCIPIEVSDYPFYGNNKAPYANDAELKDDLNRVMNGNGASDTLYWESLSSYYKKSSFNSLNLNVTIADVYKTNKTASQIMNTQVNNSTILTKSDKYVSDAFQDYKTNNPSVDTTIYDNDQNGYIDGIIAIYSAPNATNSQTIANIDPEVDLFWAYCFWLNQGVAGNVTTPIPSAYFWASYDFLYEGPGCEPGGKIDCHTMTHEFGHMMGLDDYYDYDQGKAPAGCCVMMDNNIYDHDAFSKLALGWLTPYVVTDTCTITLQPATSSGDCIILPVPGTYNGTAFGEYLLLELFTPDGLNQLDSTTAYTNREIGYNQAGVRMWHIDARIACIEYSYSNQRGWYESNAFYANQTTVKNGMVGNKEYSYQVAASNSKDYCTSLVYEDGVTDTGYELIHLIQASKSTTLSRSVTSAKNTDLFKTGNTFNLNSYKAQFPNNTKMNSGSSLPFNISFDNVSSASATITFTKTN